MILNFLHIKFAFLHKLKGFAYMTYCNEISIKWQIAFKAAFKTQKFVSFLMASHLKSEKTRRENTSAKPPCRMEKG